MNQSMMPDKDLILDVLSSQKFVTAGYSTTANECATKCVREEMLSLLKEEHDIQADIFTEAHNRGWYPTMPAEQPKIDQAKQRYQSTGL